MRRIAFVLIVVLWTGSGCGSGSGSRSGTGTGTDAGSDADTASSVDVDRHWDPGADIVATKPSILDYVNPFIGTGFGGGNIGSCYPGANVPFGLVKASPDTGTATSQPGFSHTAGYQYSDPYLLGFSHNHLHGTGIPDYGNVLLMPFAGQMTAERATRYGRKVPLDHSKEIASPGYYRTTLAASSVVDVDVSIVATTHCAYHSYAYHWVGFGRILLDASASEGDGHSKGGALTIDAKNGIVRGWNHNNGQFSGRYDGYDVWFEVQFNRPPDGTIGTWNGSALSEGSAAVTASSDPANFGAWLTFNTNMQSLEAKVCLSYVDAAGASEAMKTELPGWDFEAAKKSAEAAWQKELVRFDIESTDQTALTNFYTAVYHALQMPTIWSDVDGRYRGFDKKIHQTSGWHYVTDMSLWDTFRTAHPLYALVWPDVQRDALHSLAAMRDQGGYVPRWPMGGGEGGSMIGAHGASVAADSYLKGITDFETDTLYQGLKQTLSGPLPSGAYGGCGGISEFIDKGFVPFEADSGSVSDTLEYAYDSFCMAEWSKAMGKTADTAIWIARATNYKNLWDPKTQFFRAKHQDGTFTEPFDPTYWSLAGNPEYVEGSPWQWLWFVPHDEEGLRGLFNGNEAFVAKLESFFEQAKLGFDFLLPTAFYYHGNEPDIGAAFLFTQAGRPDLTQKWTRWILETNYKTTPDGLIGNDDAGTLAAWYVFAAIGLYPKPCVPGYYVTAPLFDKATVHLPGGDFVVQATGAAAGKVKIKSATWNGKALTEMWLQHADVAKGGTLLLQME